MSDEKIPAILTRGSARQLTMYLETSGWCTPASAHAYRAGAISERLQLAFPEDAPHPADPRNPTVAEQKAARAWLAEPLGEGLDKREIAVATACIAHHKEKQQLVPNIHVTRLMDYLGMAPTE